MDEENFHNEELQIQHFDFSSTEFIANCKGLFQFIYSHFD